MTAISTALDLFFQANLECGPLPRVPLQKAQNELAAPLTHVLGDGPHSHCKDVGDGPSQVVWVSGIFKWICPWSGSFHSSGAYSERRVHKWPPKQTTLYSPVVRRKSSTPIAQASTAHASYEGGAGATGMTPADAPEMPHRYEEGAAPLPWRGRSSGHLVLGG